MLHPSGQNGSLRRIAHAVRGLKSNDIPKLFEAMCRIAHAVRGLKYNFSSFNSTRTRRIAHVVRGLKYCIQLSLLRSGSSHHASGAWIEINLLFTELK